MPSVNENLLNDISSRTKSLPHLSLYESCDLLLDFWISHGQLKAAESVRATFMTSVQNPRQPVSTGHLLQALDQYHERWRDKAACLFNFLRRQGNPQAVYRTLRNMLAQNLYPPAPLVAIEIREMSRIDPRCALNIYKLCHKIQQGTARLLIDWCPELVIAMIRSPDFDPAEIWGALEVPLSHPHQTKLPCKPLQPSRVRLIHRMAVEFATAECRSPRLALRNVMRCMLYLRRYGVPVSADLSRALTKAGVIRSLLTERRVGREKAAWILDIVQKAEGCEVTTKMEQILQCWVTERIAQQQWLQREANPLRVGPID